MKLRAKTRLQIFRSACGWVVLLRLNDPKNLLRDNELTEELDITGFDTCGKETWTIWKEHKNRHSARHTNRHGRIWRMIHTIAERLLDSDADLGSEDVHLHSSQACAALARDCQHDGRQS